MVENVGRKVILIVALIVASILLLAYKPLFKDRPPFPLGLDIAGGERLLYRIDIEAAKAAGEVGETQTDAEILDEIIAVMRQRLDKSGNTEASIRALGSDRIEVSLPRISVNTIEARGELAAPLAADGFSLELVGSAPQTAPDAGPDGPKFIAQAYDSFPTEGVIKVGEERMLYSARSGRTLTIKERGYNRTTPVAHQPGETVTLISGDQVKSALENLGNMKFMAVAVDEDFRRAGVDQVSATNKFNEWRAKPENAGAPIAAYNLVAPEAGGPPRGLDYYPNKRPAAADPLADEGGLFVVEPAEDEKFSGADLAHVGPGQDQLGYPAIQFAMNTEDGTWSRFGQFTAKLRDKRLAIIINDEIVTSPTITEALYSTSIIQGRFAVTERDAMVTVLRSGSLKIKPELESQERIGASIGDDYVRKNAWAGAVTLVAIVVFLLFYYRRLGMWASMALLANLLLLMGAMVVVNGTLTLAGIGGIVLTMGMAVDATILIYERIREEQEKGRKPMQAAKDGFANAKSAIIDGNVTTLITALILMAVGTGTIRGFAVTLTLGILSTMFCALVMLRVFVHFELKKGIQRFEMRQFFQNANFKFMAKRKLALAISGFIIVAGCGWFIAEDDHDKLGIDFLGGATVKVRTEEPMKVEALRARVESLGGSLRSADVVDLPGSRDDSGNATEFRITFKADPETAAATASGDESVFQQEISQGLRDVLQRGPVEVSVDTSGAAPRASVVLYFEGTHQPDDVRQRVANAGLTDATAQFRGDRNNVFVVEGNLAAGSSRDALSNALTTAFAGQLDSAGREFKWASAIAESRSVGAQVVGELRDSAIKALALSSLLVLLYIRVRFAEYSYGWGALIADVHDVLATVAAMAFLIAVPWIRVEMNLTMIAAFLTILGYSLNDTIVVYDRIRENLPRVKGSLLEICDLSINQTLSRTVITSGSTIFASLIILIFNFGTGNALEGFAFALTFGVLAGTFSSIYIAAPVFVWLEERARSRSGGNANATTPPKTAGAAIEEAV